MRAESQTLTPWRTLLQALTAEAASDRLDDLLAHVAAAACQVVGAARSAVAVADDESGLEIVATFGEPPALDELKAALADAVDNAAVVRRPVDGSEPGTLPAGIQSLLRVPVRTAGRTVGALYLLDRDGERPFSGFDAQLAELVAATAAAVVRRARLAAAYEQRQNWLTESADLTRRLLAGEHDDPLHLVAVRVREMATADLTFVLTVGPQAGQYQVIAAAGPLAGRVAGRVVESQNTTAGEVIAEGAPRVLTGMSGHPTRPELAELVGAESAILVPLTGPGVEQGMLAVVRLPDKPAFSTAEIEATTVFAAQMTLALQFAESRAHRERAALLDERDRIARDLHDHVIQRLFAIGLVMQNVGMNPSADSKRLLAAVDDLDETIAQIRSTIYRLTTPILSADSSIRLRVGRLIDELEDVLGMRPELEVHGPVDLGVPDELSDDSVAVVREALTNVARHAGATAVAVRLAVDPDELVIEIIDNGRGMGESARRSGLANLRARAERRGGRLAVSAADPCGTRLTWAVPLGPVR